MDIDDVIEKVRKKVRDLKVKRENLIKRLADVMAEVERTGRDLNNSLVLAEDISETALDNERKKAEIKMLHNAIGACDSDIKKAQSNLCAAFQAKLAREEPGPQAQMKSDAGIKAEKEFYEHRESERLKRERRKKSL